MTTMHLLSTSDRLWDSLAMLHESDLEPNKIFPPKMERKDDIVSDDVPRSSRMVDIIIQQAERVLASTTQDLCLDLDLEPFPVNICSKGDDVPKTLIPPAPSSSSGLATTGLNWMKQDHDTWLNFSKDLSIASTRLEDTLDIFINSISHDDNDANIGDDCDWISTDDDLDQHDEAEQDLYPSMSRPLKRRKQTDDGAGRIKSLHTLTAPCVSPSLSSSSSTSSSHCSSSSNKTSSTTTTSSDDGQEVRFRLYQADQWMERFEDLRCFKAEFGNCLVPHSYPPNQQLAQWVKRQRYQYKLKSENRHSTLTVERQQELEDLGFVWDSHKAAWYERLEALKQYRAKYGNCMVPTNFAHDKPLAVWVKCQRRQRSFGLVASQP